MPLEELAPGEDLAPANTPTSVGTTAGAIGTKAREGRVGGADRLWGAGEGRLGEQGREDRGTFKLRATASFGEGWGQHGAGHKKRSPLLGPAILPLLSKCSLLNRVFDYLILFFPPKI